MFYKNIYFHNVNYMPKDVDGSYSLSRLPAENVNDYNNAEAFVTSGVELRFKMVSNEVSVTLKCNPGEIGEIQVYFGSFFAGSEFTKTITSNGVTVTVLKHNVTSDYFDKEKAYTAPFSSDVIRIILPSVHTRFVSVSGKTCIPSPQEMPKTTVLFFGGSVLQSKTYTPTMSLPFMIASKLDVDYINIGLKNSIIHSENMARYIASKRFDVAVIECANEPFDNDEFSLFRKNLKLFVKYLSRNKKRKLFFIDRFYADYEGKKSHYEKKLKSINALIKKHNSIDVFDQVDYKDLTPSRNEYTSVALFDAYSAILKEIDRVVPPYTEKDKKAMKHPTLYAEMSDDETPITSPKTLSQKEINAILKNQKQAQKELGTAEKNASKKNKSSETENGNVTENQEDIPTATPIENGK